jgi:hypothetical protein
MQKTSILLVIEREDAIHRSVSRALMLARYLHARLDIMFCDIAGPSMRPSSTALSSVSKDAQDYLFSLRNYIIAPDIEITTNAAFEGTVAEHVLRKLQSNSCAMVIKSVSRVHDGLVDARPAWDLIRNSRAPLLLTRGEPWHPKPRFAAAVDFMNRRSSGQPLAVAQIGESLRLACDAQLDLIRVQAPDAQGEPSEDWRLQGLGRQLTIAAQRLHTIAGHAGDALPRFVAQQDYDLLAIGAADAPGDVQERGLLEHLLRLTLCDLLFVNTAQSDPQRTPNRWPDAPVSVRG